MIWNFCGPGGGEGIVGGGEGGYPIMSMSHVPLKPLDLEAVESVYRLPGRIHRTRPTDWSAMPHAVPSATQGKAENQNNMINALFGEIVNILDMNQDAYYSEGLKVPLILTLFSKRVNLVINATSKSTKNLIAARDKKGEKRNARDQRLEHILGDDDAGILGFREHVFTYRHSVVGRYMALAEQAFGTLVQRFLSSPHHIRMHYGHPDMTNAHMMRRTAGVSRGSLRVNVNEDIFLGYEMVLQGVDIIFTEWLFYGKGRDVEFNAASVFLKKLAQGCVMQLASRQVRGRPGGLTSYGPGGPRGTRGLGRAVPTKRSLLQTSSGTPQPSLGCPQPFAHVRWRTFGGSQTLSLAANQGDGPVLCLCP